VASVKRFQYPPSRQPKHKKHQFQPIKTNQPHHHRPRQRKANQLKHSQSTTVIATADRKTFSLPVNSPNKIAAQSTMSTTPTQYGGNELKKKTENEFNQFVLYVSIV
jgi:hypothetical protein